ncbi:hypothetical protein QE382_003171 [Sphingobacterium zeae]|uniref:Uncharacterized protein n=1 Tax=Sphingobacterium zeae TaxID=1776859 RepID=A0ABU0U893_9SPHI|nr:hypothetical protein [Sphingobacterium zeae]MDQ1151187.1 hypothetical protein [Sphingobacterium zeae]
MENSSEGKFREKAKIFRLHFNLSEEDIDQLLKGKDLVYSKVESGKRTITLELAESYPFVIFGIDYCVFKRDETTFPEYEKLPLATRELLESKSNAGNKVGSKGTKNKASYVVIVIKDFKEGHKFIKSEIISVLPSPLNLEKSIDWNKGLLKGLVKNTNTSKNWVDENGKKHREAIYEMIKEVDVKLLEKAKKSFDQEALKEFEEKLREK